MLKVIVINDLHQNAAQAELLELSNIAPETTVEVMAEQLPLLDPAALASAMAEANRIVSI